MSCRFRQRRQAAAKAVSCRLQGRRATVFSRFGSGQQSCQLQASRATFLASSQSDVRHWHRGFGSAVGTGMPRCFAVSEAAAKAVSCRLQRCQLQASRATFLARSESDVRHRHRGFGSAVGTACHGVLPFRKRPPKLSAAGFKGYFSSGLRKRR